MNLKLTDNRNSIGPQFLNFTVCTCSDHVGCSQAKFKQRVFVQVTESVFRDGFMNFYSVPFLLTDLSFLDENGFDLTVGFVE